MRGRITIKNYEHLALEILVERIQPERLFSYRWHPYASDPKVDYSAEPRLTLGFAGTPMSASALKRMWPVLIVPELREWVLARVERGSTWPKFPGSPP